MKKDEKQSRKAIKRIQLLILAREYFDVEDRLNNMPNTIEYADGENVLVLEDRVFDITENDLEVLTSGYLARQKRLVEMIEELVDSEAP